MKLMLGVVLVLLFLLVEAGAEEWKILSARYVASGSGACLVCSARCEHEEAVEIKGPDGRRFVHVRCSGIDGWNPWGGARRADGAPIERWRMALTYD